VKRKAIKLDKIRLDGETQPRSGIVDALVSDYALAYEANADIPPITVFFDGSDYWLADGFHRWHAQHKRQVETIYCEIHEGSVEDARWFSYGANQAHGLRRSNADKAKAVIAALKHPKGAGMSDSQIAEHVGVDHKTVGRYRTELESTWEVPKSTVRTGQDGRTYDTTNIGKSAEAELAKVPEEDREKVLGWATEKGDGKPFTAKLIRESAAEVADKESDDDDSDVVEEAITAELMDDVRGEEEPEKPEPDAKWIRICKLIDEYADSKSACVVAAMLENKATELRNK
jgi:hypothetical protein